MAPNKQVLKIKVISAHHLKNVDHLGSLTDPYCLIFCEGRSAGTRVIKNNLNPVWNEQFEFEIHEPNIAVVNIMVWDQSKIRHDIWVGGTSLSLNVLRPDQTQVFELPLLRNLHEGGGTITVELTAIGFSGLMAAIQALESTEKKFEDVELKFEDQVTALKNEVTELKKVNQNLETEVSKFREENNKYQQLNAQLESTSKKFEAEVTVLHGEVNKFSEENKKLEETRQALQKEVGELKSQVDKFHEENKKLEETRKALEKEVTDLKGEVNKFHEENKKLEETRKALEKDIEQLKEEVSKFHEENKKLEETRKALDTQVQNLKAESAQFAEQNQKLQDNVAQFSNKMKIMSNELKNLQKTREMLDEQVARQDAQNNQFKEELNKFHTLEEGMKALASKQGEDYALFVKKLTESINKHKELIRDFADQNNRLRETRKKGRIDHYLEVSHTFSMMDHKVGLSLEEFQEYLSIISSDFPEIWSKLEEKMGGGVEFVFKQLDKDKSGALSLGELKVLVEALVKADEEHEQQLKNK